MMSFWIFRHFMDDTVFNVVGLHTISFLENTIF